MGAKSLYKDTRKKIIHQLIISKDIKAIKGVLKDKDSYKKFASKWQAVNLDEYVAKFNITDDKYNMAHNLRKISFFNDGRNYEIVAAIGAKYFRVREVLGPDKYGPCLTLDLKEPSIPGTFQGKERSAERQRLTHFRMSYKKGTV